MATRRTTYGKMQRDRDKRAKAAAKRARRQGRTPDVPEGPGVPVAEEETEAQEAKPTLPEATVLARLEALHESFDAGKMSFEQFEEAKAALLEQLEVA